MGSRSHLLGHTVVKVPMDNTVSASMLSRLLCRFAPGLFSQFQAHRSHQPLVGGVIIEPVQNSELLVLELLAEWTSDVPFPVSFGQRKWICSVAEHPKLEAKRRL